MRLHLPARLTLLTGVVRCILEDLSVSGAALILPEQPPSIGASGILQCEMIEAFGTIRWVRYGRCGLMFDEHLPLSSVVALRHVADSHDDAERERMREGVRAWVEGKV